MTRGKKYRRWRSKQRKELAVKRLAESMKWAVGTEAYHDIVSDDRATGIISKTPKQCSCHMCGNPRKYYDEKTIQELKLEEEFEEWDKASMYDWFEWKNIVELYEEDIDDLYCDYQLIGEASQ